MKPSFYEWIFAYMDQDGHEKGFFFICIALEWEDGGVPVDVKTREEHIEHLLQNYTWEYGEDSMDAVHFIWDMYEAQSF